MKLKRFFVALVLAVFIMAFLPYRTIVAAPLPSLNIYTDKSSYRVGEEMRLHLEVDAAGASIGAVRLILNYDPAIFSFKENVFDSAFAADLGQNIDTQRGVISLSRGHFGGLREKALFCHLSFKVLQAKETSISTADSLFFDSSGKVVSFSADSLTFYSQISSKSLGVKSSSRKKTTLSPLSSSTKISVFNSSVIFDKSFAKADGQDKITVTVTLKNSDKAVVTQPPPQFSAVGEVNFNNFRQDKTSYAVDLTTTVAGTKLIRVSAGGILLKEQSVIFLPPSSPATTISQDEGKVTPLTHDPNNNAFLTALNAQVVVKNGFFRSSLIIEGEGRPDSRFTLYLYPLNYSQEVSVDNSGHWRVIYNKKLPNGKYRLEATVKDEYGSESVAKVLKEFEIKQNPLFFYLSLFFVVIVVGVFIAKRKFSPLVSESPPS